MPSYVAKRRAALALLAAIAILNLQPTFAYPTPQGRQQEECTPPPPATKLETFSAQTGVVLIRGFSRIGLIRGKGSVTVAASEFRDASNPKARVTGLSISVRESDTAGREKTSFVDYDEIDSLVKGIDYIARTDRNVTRLTNFEAEYRTKGDFSVATYSTGSGIRLAVSSGICGRVTAHLETTDLNQLKTLIENGRAVIDSALQSANR
jgi:hypothetical protein